MTDKELRNPGWDNRFTCPLCMFDINDAITQPNLIDECPQCGVGIECTVERQSVAICRLTNHD